MKKVINIIKITTLMMAAVILSGTISFAAGNTTAEEYFLEASEVYNSRHFAESIILYSKAIESKPDFVEAYFGRGSAFGMIGDRDRAMADFDRILQINPNEAQAYYNKGLLYEMFFEREKAIEEFEKFIEHATFQTPPESLREAKKKINRIKTELEKRKEAEQEMKEKQE